MQERLSLFLKLTAFFVFQFWLMIVNHYSLRGSLLGLPATAVVGSSAIVLFAVLVVRVIKPTASKLYVVPAIGSIFVVAFVASTLQNFSFADELICSKRYPSPSGRAAVVVEDHEVFGDVYYSSAYFDWLMVRKHVGHYPGYTLCDERFITLKWSADERQVDWDTLGEGSDSEGCWRF